MHMKIYYTLDIRDAHKADFVFEAITEDLDLKRRFFKDVEKYVPRDIVFATNTSSYTVTEISRVLDHPARVCAMHFSNPPLENGASRSCLGRIYF